jgi:methyltransferase
MVEGTLLLGFVTLQRLAELAWAHHNTSRLLAAGGVEFGRPHYKFLVALHAIWLGGLWLVGSHRPVEPLLLGVFVILQLGRAWVILTLGGRWTTRVIVVPGEMLVAHGPYRWLRHPNYLIVAAEIAVVPLALGLVVYAAAFSVLNTALLFQRIRIETAALGLANGTLGRLEGAETLSLRGCPETLCGITKLSQHEANGCER